VVHPRVVNSRSGKSKGGILEEWYIRGVVKTSGVEFKEWYLRGGALSVNFHLVLAVSRKYELWQILIFPQLPQVPVEQV